MQLSYKILMTHLFNSGFVAQLLKHVACHTRVQDFDPLVLNVTFLYTKHKKVYNINCAFFGRYNRVYFKSNLFILKDNSIYDLILGYFLCVFFKYSAITVSKALAQPPIKNHKPVHCCVGQAMKRVGTVTASDGAATTRAGAVCWGQLTG